MVDQIIASIRDRLTNSTHPTRISDLVEDVLRTTEPELRAFELAGRYVSRIQDRLLQIYNQILADGDDPWFEFNSIAPDCIQGPCHIEQSDSTLAREAKARRIRAEPMRHVLEALSFQDFELLCGAVTALLGAREYQVTPRSRDQGIDFYGRLFLSDYEAPGFPFVRFQHDLRVWLVGQAKHYPHGKVSTPEIRNLVGSINLARFKEYASTTELLRDLPIRSCDPVFAIFLTTGVFTKDARQLATNSGVIMKDIVALSNYLADKDVGVDSDGSPTKDELLQWANQTIASCN